MSDFVTPDVRDRMPLPVPRYVVTELEGYLTPVTGKAGRKMGLSCHVIDTAWNHQLVATYRTESYRAGLGWSHETIRSLVRRKARGHADRLNASFDC